MRRKCFDSAFTLMEILIVTAIIAVIGAIVILLLNPWKQIAKAHDSKRKADLSSLRRALEEWYNDHGCYPKPNEICYANDDDSTPANLSPCKICGKEPGSPKLTPYLPELPCEPKHPRKYYLYQINDLTCPQWYKIYTNLDDTSDVSINQIGCTAGSCGIVPTYGFNYGISSPNVGLDKTPYLTCFTWDNRCNSCGVDGCGPGCRIIYATLDQCCEANHTCDIFNCVDKDTGICGQCGYSSGYCLLYGNCCSGTLKKIPTPCPICGGVTVTPTPTPTTVSCSSSPAYCFKGSICNLCAPPAGNCQLPGVCNTPLILYTNTSCTTLCTN